MKRTSIRKKFLLGIIVFAIVLILGLSLLVAQRQFIIAKNNASEKAFSYARLAAKLIDGDRISGYLETGKKDQYYQQILHCLNEAQLQAGLKYYYVFVPFEKDLVYIWDAQNLEGACDLGDREDYMQGGKEAVEKDCDPDAISEIANSWGSFIPECCVRNHHAMIYFLID